MKWRQTTARPKPRRTRGQLRAMTVNDRRPKAERNDRRGRDRPHVPGVKRRAHVGRVPVPALEHERREVDLQKIMGRLLGAGR